MDTRGKLLSLLDKADKLSGVRSLDFGFLGDPEVIARAVLFLARRVTIPQRWEIVEHARSLNAEA